MEFNPDEFLAQAETTSIPKDTNTVDSGILKNTDMTQLGTQSGQLPEIEGFDPDAFLADAKEEQYGTLGQQLKTGAEGLAEGLIGSIPTDFVEHEILGVKPEDKAARKEINPGVSLASQAAGMGVGLLTGVGEAGLAMKAGSMASKLVTGAKAAESLPMITRIGARALQEATEMAIMTSDDEIAKMIWHKPETSADAAIANIGLATALGGAGGAFVAGAVSPLWKATVGPKVEGYLAHINSRLGREAIPTEAPYSMSEIPDIPEVSKSTSKVLDKVSEMFSSPLMMVAALTGNGPSALITQLAFTGIKEAASSTKLAMLKFLGSEQPINPAAFKSAVQYVDAAIKGETKLNKAVDAVFKGGTINLTNISENDIDKLSTTIDNYSEDNGNEVLDKLVNNETNYYLPDHQPALAATTVRALGYLKTLKPEIKQVNSLNTPVPPTRAEERRYKQALEIAQNPLITLGKLKDGTLQVNDLQDLASMYPSMYKQMQQKILSQVVNRKVDDEPIPYRTKVAISLFVGQPLDSTMEPASIIAAQPKPQQNPQQPQAPKKNTDKLGKTNSMHQTASQSAEANRKTRD